MHQPPAPSQPVHDPSRREGRAATDWLDVHFEAARPEYETMLRSVGLRRGWHVLDAGCGGGSFLQLIAAEVGPTGQITAVDLAAESIAVLEPRIASWGLDCPVSIQVGSVRALPFSAGSFDAVWCANTVQYLTDDELMTALAEFRRVVRPGGIVAIKEANGTIWNFAPGDPGRMWRFLNAARDTERQIHGLLRTPELRRRLEAAGCVDVWQRTTLCERWAPLRAAERQFYAEIFVWVAQLAEHAWLSDDDHAFWRMTLNPDAPEHPLNHADFSTCDAQTIVVGRVPGDTA